MGTTELERQMATKILSGERQIRVGGKMYRLVPQGNQEYTLADVKAAREAIAEKPNQTPRIVCGLLVNKA